MTVFTEDPVKRRIVTELQRNGRMTNQELAERVGLSASPCWRRVRELEETGVIRRYAAILDPEKVGVGECVFAQVTVDKHVRDSAKNFERAVRDRPEVLECYSVTGDADFLLKIHVPNVKSYDRFLQDFVQSMPGVSQVKSSFALREVKYDTALPIPSEADDA